MLKRLSKLIVAAGFGLTTFFMAAPLAFADNTVSTTGTDSSNTINNQNYSSYTQTNTNSVTITNNSSQTSSSGDATVSGNTTGGSATSGNATNSNSTSTTVNITNISSLPSGGSSGSNTISNTGADSYNTINAQNHSSVSITNTNYVTVTNSNWQSASTGSASVKHNTTGGSATSGNAGNSNCTFTDVSINNGGMAPAAAANPCGAQNGGGQGGNGGNNGGTGNTTGQGGNVLGAFTVASVGGHGVVLGAAQLPNTGARDGISPWAIVTTFTLFASVAYWRLVISPRLKSL